MERQEAHKTVRVGDRSISYTRTGKGAPVLMLHGGGPGASGMSNYVRNIDALAAQFDVIVPDMPGYGASTKGLGRDDPFGELASSMLGLLDALGIPLAHIVGNSLGGACGLRMALDAPQRVGRLVLMGPGGIDTTRSLPTPGLRALLNYYKDEGPSREKLREFITRYLVADGAAVPDEVLETRFQSSIGPDVVAAPPLTGPSGLKAALRMDFTRDRRLAEMTHPTLILWGREDKVNRPSGATSLAKRLRNADVFMFANTGHWVQWERAEEFNAITAAFLRRAGEA